ncbi:MAG TPA: hypothetical protein VKE98_16515, partial [Gemmataceae bacterium]|nr:hypothetical protein [Gemmataceae bacterium]
MTETEWLCCDDPVLMLNEMESRTSDRKLRLLAVACHRRILHLLSDQTDCCKTLEFAERFADGLASRNELRGRAWGKPGSAFSVVLYKAWAAAENSLEFGAGTVKEAVLRMDPEKHKKREDAFRAARANNSLGEAMRIADAAMPSEWVAKGRSAWTEERVGQCQVIREVFGSMCFRTVHLDPSWLTGEAKNTVKSVYDERAFDRMPILADALEEA